MLRRSVKAFRHIMYNPAMFLFSSKVPFANRLNPDNIVSARTHPTSFEN